MAEAILSHIINNGSKNNIITKSDVINVVSRKCNVPIYELKDFNIQDIKTFEKDLKNKQNMGLNYTLNKCLEKCTSKYIARQDGDDISLPTRFEKEIKILEKNKKYALVSSSMTSFDENGDFVTDEDGNLLTEKKETVSYGYKYEYVIKFSK